MKGWINSSKLPEAMLRGCCGGFGAGAGASAILASLGCGGCPGRGALCRGVLLGCERWLALALRPRAARSCLCGRLCRGGALLFGVKRVFSPGPMRGDVFYRPLLPIGMCGGGWWRFGGFFGGPNETRSIFCVRLQDQVSEHAEGSVLAERSAMSRRKTTLAFGSALEPPQAT